MAIASPPYLKGLPILGNLIEFKRSPHDFLLKIALQANAPIVNMQLGPTQLWLICDADLAQEVLVKQQKNFLRGDNYRQILAWNLGDSLIVSEGAYHAQQRKMIQPAFHATRIYAYAETIVNLTLKLLETWQKVPLRDVHLDMMQLTMEAVSQTLFNDGLDSTEEAHEVGAAIRFLQEDINIRFLRIISPPRWWYAEKRRVKRVQADLNLVKNKIYQFIHKRRAAGCPDTGDLLSILLLSKNDEGIGMTDDEVYHEAVTLFSAGHETTSHALTWTWYLLASHPEVMEKVHAELDRVLAGRTPTVADLRQLTYLNQVFKESMRLYPPIWAIPTRQAQADTALGDYAVTKGTLFSVAPYVLHHHPRYWQDPERFLPERFAPENETKLHKYQYLPFGGGVHTCIGNSFAMMEAMLILATLASRSRLDLLPQHVQPYVDVTLHPKHGLKLRVQPR